MVAKNSGIRRLEDLRGRTICVEAGTTSLQNFTDWMRKEILTILP